MVGCEMKRFSRVLVIGGAGFVATCSVSVVCWMGFESFR